MKLIQPSLHGQNARMHAPVTDRPVMYTPARSGLTPFRSQNTGACASAAITADCAETSTHCPRPVAVCRKGV